MSYPIEVRLASKNGYFTPTEARAYYGRYDRHGITWHWWGDGTGAGNHDNIVNYMNNQAAQGQKSVNYVLSDGKITLCVGPDNVAWASQGGNPVSNSVELQPTLNAEGYKKAGWLASEIAGRYGGDRVYYPHYHWFSTSCPGTISLDRIRQEEDKWQSGAYNPAPAPAPTPTPTPIPPITDVPVTFHTITPATFVCNKQPTKLYQVNKNSWNGIGVIKEFNKGDRVDVYGIVKNDTLKSEHYITKYSYDNKLPNGFSKSDLDLYVAPVPTPPPTLEPVVTPLSQPIIMYTLSNAKLVNVKDMSIVKTYVLDTAIEVSAKARFNDKEFYYSKYAYEKNTKQGFLVGDLKPDLTTPNPEPTPIPIPPTPDPTLPEWEANLRDIDNTQYWFKQNQELIDITTGNPVPNKGFAKDESFVASALTKVGTTEYRITEYSYSKGIFNGVPISSLTLTPPGQPDIDPIPDYPIDKNVVVAFLESLIDLIQKFIDGLGKKPQ